MSISKRELEKLRLIYKQQQELPHLYGFPLYKWQEDFFNYPFNKDKIWSISAKGKVRPTEKQVFLCACNQRGKSSIQIKKLIHWATSPELWPKLWPSLKRNTHQVPQFWYLYPDKNFSTAEWVTKWLPEFMPKGSMKNDPKYGWKSFKDNRQIHSVIFNSGAILYFKTYAQNPQSLQGGTVHGLFCDEELPEDLHAELFARMYETEGYFHMAFTATLGQAVWKYTIEPTREKENFKGALKMQISAYDCLKYADGSESPWTEERIKHQIAQCTSEAEVKRRIYGRFVVDSGLRYPCFVRSKHLVDFPSKNGKPFTGVPPEWFVYTGVDIGSGGSNHPAAFVFISVSPDYKRLRVFKGRRLDGIGDTTTGDILIHYKNSKGKLGPVVQSYDWASKEFEMVASRNNEMFVKAQKDPEGLARNVNTLFKAGMLKIYNFEDSDKLCSELETVKVDDKQQKAKNDFINAVEYAISNIPIDYGAITFEKVEETEVEEEDPRMKGWNDYLSQREENADNWQDQFNEINMLIHGDEN